MQPFIKAHVITGEIKIIMKPIKLSFLMLLLATISWGQSTTTISGQVRDSTNQETLPMSTVKIVELNKATSTDLDGNFSIEVPPGKYTVEVVFVGYTKQTRQVDATKNVHLNMTVAPDVLLLKEAEVHSERADQNVTSTEMGTEEIKVDMIKKLPAVLGEADPVKAIQLLPGVQNAGEGTGGFFVRGGDNSQNLVLFDNMPIYSASHLFGFFSVFNADAVSDVKLYKGNMPAQYGGRLSSLLDVSMKKPATDKLHGDVGIGLISSRLTLDGPIGKNTSFLLSGRRSYVDLFLMMSPDTNVRKNRVHFYDVNGKIKHKINDNNHLVLSGYMGQDVFKFGDEFKMGWGNKASSLTWQHTFNDRWFSESSATISDFRYFLEIPSGQQGFRWEAGVGEYAFQENMKHFFNEKNTIRFGLSSAYRVFNLGEVDPVGNTSVFKSFVVGKDKSFEHAVYLSNEQKVGSKLVLDYGVRYSAFQQVGLDTINTYGGKDGETVLEREAYDQLEVVKTYHGLEPRFAARFKLDSSSSVKASYSRTRQNIHLVSNTTASSPFDVWISSSKHIKPQISDQVSLGYFRNFRDNMYAGSVEVYYKNMQNQIDFKPNKQILLNPNVETAVLSGIGWSYGSELMIKKQSGRLQGWISYTLSKTQRRIEGINNDKPYSPTYDKTHDIAVVATYDYNEYWSFAANWVYTTGSAVTFPAGNYVSQGYSVPYYTERNGYRLPDYHRFDVSATKNIRKGWFLKKYDRKVVFSVYNAYFRKNTFSVFFRDKVDSPGQKEAVKTYLFGVIPSVTYNVSF